MSTALLTRPSRHDRAFERLYKRHVHEVYRYVLAVLRNPADAEDATQATFLNAYRAFSRGEEPLKPRNWLLKIAHNECRQRFRASSRRPKEVEWDERAAAPEADESVPTADEIRTALAHLSFNQRSALVMRELEGRSYAEIGTILDLSNSAVETLLFRARRALREQLEGALTCGEAEATLSKRLDGRLALSEQRSLRAHLRECPECAQLERKQRARRTAIKGLGVEQLPRVTRKLFRGERRRYGWGDRGLRRRRQGRGGRRGGRRRRGSGPPGSPGRPRRRPGANAPPGAASAPTPVRECRWGRSQRPGILTTEGRRVSGRARRRSARPRRASAASVNRHPGSRAPVP